MTLLSNAEQAAVSEIKKGYLGASSAVQAEVAKLIGAEQGFVRNNAYWLLALNGALFLAIGWFAHSIF